MKRTKPAAIGSEPVRINEETTHVVASTIAMGFAAYRQVVGQTRPRGFLAPTSGTATRGAQRGHGGRAAGVRQLAGERGIRTRVSIRGRGAVTAPTLAFPRKRGLVQPSGRPAERTFEARPQP